SSRTIGLVVLDVANPFFTDVARAVEDVASEHGLAVLLCNSDDQPAKEAAYLDLLTEQRVQGVVITPTAALSPGLDAAHRRGVRERPAGPRHAAGTGPAGLRRPRRRRPRRLRRHRVRRGGRRAAHVGAQAAGRARPAGRGHGPGGGFGPRARAPAAGAGA